MNDYELARENFVNMGEMMLRLIYQVSLHNTYHLLSQNNIGWQEFLSYYTDLNLARKKYDEKFTEERGIGEEVEDPQKSDDDEEFNKPVNEESLPKRNRLTQAYKLLSEDDENKRSSIEKNNAGHAIQMEEEFKE